MWSGPIHDTEFVTKVLEHTEANTDQYGTAARMKGMLTVAKEVCINPNVKSELSLNVCCRSFIRHFTLPPQKSLAASIARLHLLKK